VPSPTATAPPRRVRWIHPRPLSDQIGAGWVLFGACIAVGGVLASRAAGPLANRSSPRPLLVLLVAVAGGAFGTLIGAWRGRRLGQQATSRAEAGAGKFRLHDPTRTAVGRVATFVLSIVLTVVVLGILGLGAASVGFLVGSMASTISPELVAALGAAAAGFGLGSAISQRVVLGRWEHQHGATVLRGVVRSQFGKRKPKFYSRTYPGNRATVAGSRTTMTLPVPRSIDDDRAPFDTMIPAAQWLLLYSARQWQKAAAVAQATYEPSSPMGGLMVAMALMRAGQGEAAVTWLERARADGWTTHLGRRQRRVFRSLHANPRFRAVNA